MKHVIIGNGPAGVVAAETIRKHRPNDTIVLIGDEPVPPYSRMAIPYLLSATSMKREPIFAKAKITSTRSASRRRRGA